TESALELIAIGDAERAVRDGGTVDRQQDQVRDPGTLTAGVGDADIRQDPMGPGIESVRIAEVLQVSPGDHQRVLQGILAPIDVPEDPVGDREEPVAARLDQVDERRLVTALGPLDEVAIHRPPVLTPVGSAVRLYWSMVRRQRSKTGAC